MKSYVLKHIYSCICWLYRCIKPTYDGTKGIYLMDWGYDYVSDYPLSVQHGFPCVSLPVIEALACELSLIPFYHSCRIVVPYVNHVVVA